MNELLREAVSRLESKIRTPVGSRADILKISRTLIYSKYPTSIVFAVIDQRHMQKASSAYPPWICSDLHSL